jgi:hypothetical protein
VTFPAAGRARKETQVEQTPQAVLSVTPQVAFRVQRAVQVAGSQEPSVSVPAQQVSAARRARARARPEAPAVVVRPVPFSQVEVRPSEERKESVFAGPASAQPVQNAPEELREASEPQEVSPSAGAAEVARTVAVLQEPAFAAAVRKGGSQPEERREIWAPASAPVVSAPAWALVFSAGPRAGPALWLEQGRFWRCPIHSQRIWSRKALRQRSTRERGRAIAELGACTWPLMNTSQQESPRMTVRPIDG